MMRIYATFLNLRDPKLNKLTQPWRDDLAKWVIEIVKGAYAYQYKDSYLLPNYLANTNASHNCQFPAEGYLSLHRMVKLT
jgi:hypothetical protein